MAARVRAARAYAGLEQAQVAKALGDLSVATYKRMEQGSRPVSSTESTIIATVCGVPTSFMAHGFDALAAREQKLRATLTTAEGAAAGALMRLMIEATRNVHEAVLELHAQVLDSAPSPHMAEALATARAVLNAAADNARAGA